VRIKEFLELRTALEPKSEVWALFAELVQVESKTENIIPLVMKVPGMSEAICGYDPLLSKIKMWVEETIPPNLKEGEPRPEFPMATILSRISNLLGRNAFKNLCLGWVISQVGIGKSPKSGGKKDEKFRLDPSKEIPATLALDLWAQDKGVPIRTELFYAGYLWDASMRYAERKGLYKITTKGQAQYLADVIKDLDKAKITLTNAPNKKMGARWAEAYVLRKLAKLWLLAFSESNTSQNLEAFEKASQARKIPFSPLMTAWRERGLYQISYDEIAYLLARSVSAHQATALSLRFMREEGGSFFKPDTFEREVIDALKQG